MRVRAKKGNSVKEYHYWIMSQYWKGFTTKEIALATGLSKNTIYWELNKLGSVIPRNTKKKIKRINQHYGLSEIARELGISRQRVHQKVKACLSPYIKYPCTGRPKKKDNT